MLVLEGINAGYGNVQVLRDLSLDVQPGEIHCLLGRNGAGKTTTMRAIMGLVPLTLGRVTLNGQDIGTLPPHEVPKRGIGYIPQGRRLFSDLTVAQNLEIGMMARASPPRVLDEVLHLFPRLRDRLHQRAQTLSGGEQQMLATARALCLEPEVLLLDEPTEGLQPSMIEAIRTVITRMRDRGVAVLLVEQRVDAILSVADRVSFIENGRRIEAMTVAELKEQPDVLHRHLGV